MCRHEDEERQWKLSVLTSSRKASVETECVDMNLKSASRTECTDIKEERPWKLSVLT